MKDMKCFYFKNVMNKHMIPIFCTDLIRMKISSKIFNKYIIKVVENHEVNKRRGKNKLIEEGKEWTFSLELLTTKALNTILCKALINSNITSI